MVFLQRQNRSIQPAGGLTINKESVFNQSPVKIDTLIKYKSLKTTPLVYKDSSGPYHHINIAINDGEYGGATMPPTRLPLLDPHPQSRAP
jgi:hypothetical protein